MKQVLFISVLLFSNIVLAQNHLPNSGNVGIGTTNPNKLLHVEANIAGDHSAIIENKSVGGFGLIINSHNDPIRIGSLGNYDGDRFIIKNSGNVGIGVYNPSKTLHVRSTSDNDHSAIIENSSTTGYGLILNSANDPLRVGSLGNYSGNYLIVNSDGKVGIGTTDFAGDHKLRVEGSIGAREIKVEANGWSDFVFEKDYELRTLEEVENYISKNKHLPEIPSETEVTENGINLGEMDAKLLQKIEELTLYLIQQSRQNQSQQAEIEALKAKINQPESE